MGVIDGLAGKADYRGHHGRPWMLSGTTTTISSLHRIFEQYLAVLDRLVCVVTELHGLRSRFIGVFGAVNIVGVYGRVVGVYAMLL